MGAVFQQAELLYSHRYDGEHERAVRVLPNVLCFFHDP